MVVGISREDYLFSCGGFEIAAGHWQVLFAGQAPSQATDSQNSNSQFAQAAGGALPILSLFAESIDQKERAILATQHQTNKNKQSP